jgi:hypothetical protein
VDEDILTAGALDKSIALCGVKPFDNTLFSHYFKSPLVSPPCRRHPPAMGRDLRQKLCHCRMEFLGLQWECSDKY